MSGFGEKYASQDQPSFFSQTTSIFENSCLGPLNWNIHHCAQSQVSRNFYFKNWLCLTCTNSIFPFHSLANNELSDLFNEGFLYKISSVELNNQFSNQPNNSLNFKNTDKNDTLLDISLNDRLYILQLKK